MIFNHPSITRFPRYFSCPPSPCFATKSNPKNDFITWNKKISDLVRSNRITEAKDIFDNLKQRNTVTWNSMINGYIRRREMAKARMLFDQMPERDIVSWNIMISGYISSKLIDEGRCLFDHMPDRDIVSWNTMISGYARIGQMDDALVIFNSMPEKNVVSFNALITGFLQNGNVKSAIELFERMPERDSASFSALTSGLIQNDELDKAVKILLKCRETEDKREDLVHAYNTLIAGYGQRGLVDEARRIFDQIPFDHNKRKGDARMFVRNLVTWNSMIMCYINSGDVFSARTLFDEMTERDTFSWNTMISAYVHLLNMEEASYLFHKMPNPDTLTWNSVISGYAQIGNLRSARQYFTRTPYKNLVSWNSIIAGYEKNGDYVGAIELFIEMQVEGEKPDRHTLSSVLSACAGSTALRQGRQIHQQVTKRVIPDLPVNNSLVTMYARCGAIVEAQTLFNEMKSQKDVISWNAMIGGYAFHGFAAEALELFGLMKRLKVLPTYITFISVLNACAHVGLVEEGQRQFESMVTEFGIEPRVEHYALLVDLVGRYGQLEEAMGLINRMPFQPDKAVWGALLAACRVHNNVDLARVAAEALMTLEPESSAPYVTLYNMYADAGRWDDAAEVRDVMDRNNIVKQTAYSWVDSAHSG